MRVLTFFLLESLLSPLSLTSLILLQGWSITISRQQHTSITALVPLYFRWLLHIQGIRPDETTHQLISNLTGLNSALCWGSIGPTLFAANLTGYTPSFLSVPPASRENVSNMIYTRSLFFDKALAQQLSKVEQVVLLGAGYDTRLFKFCLGQGLSLFEVDQIATQQAKIQALRKSGVALDEVSFIPVDFEQGDWANKLQRAGFKPNKKSFFLWEGVTYYLTEKAVKDTLARVATLSGTGSAIAFDIFSSNFVTASREWQWIQPAIAALDVLGEPFRFGTDLTDSTHITRLLQDAGFQRQTSRLIGARKSAFSELISAVKV